MEKYVVFGPIILFFGFFLLLIIGFLGFVIRLMFRAKNAAWTGEVINKKINEVEDDNGRKEQHFVYQVRMDNGQTHYYPATAGFYKELQIGDRLEKKKGEMHPIKI
jgi:hypothetical protein